MNFKVKDKKLTGIDKKVTFVFGEHLEINDFVVNGPGEYEVSGVLITVFNDYFYSMRTESGLHIAYWCPEKGSIESKNGSLGRIDALVLALDGLSDIKKALTTINDLEPGNIVLATSRFKDELRKAESLPVEEAESWKASSTEGNNGRKLILLPCANQPRNNS